MSTRALHALIDAVRRGKHPEQLAKEAAKELEAVERAAVAFSGGDGAPGLGDAYGHMDAISAQRNAGTS